MERSIERIVKAIYVMCINKQGDEVPPTALLAWLVQIDLSLKHLVIAQGTF